MTALHCACGSPPLMPNGAATSGVLVVKCLLECPDIDIHAVDENEGKTALHWAAERSNNEIIKLLLTAGANVNAVEEKSGRTPLHTACDTRLPPRTSGRTPPRRLLPAITAATATATIQLLCTAGADLNAIDKINGQTPLHGACASGRLLVAKELLRHGADRRIADAKGCIALHDSVFVSPNGDKLPDMARLILEYDQVVFHRDMLKWTNHIGDTPLHCALFNHGNNGPSGSIDLGKLNIVTAKYFIEVGADVFQENKAGIKPIDCIPEILKMDIECESHRDDADEASGLSQHIQLLTALVPLMQERVESCNTESDYADINMRNIGGKMMRKVMTLFDGSGEQDISLGQSWRPGLTGRLLECMFRTGPAGLLLCTNSFLG
jgi:uncharacterized protein